MSSINLSVTIMAHPKRKPYAKHLARELGAQIVWDQKNDRWDTGRRSLLAHLDTGSQYSLVVQDDAITPTGFLPAVKNALTAILPESPLVLYMTRTTKWAPVLNTVPEWTSFVVMDRIWWGVGIVVPTHQIGRMVEYCDGLTEPQYDHRLGTFYQQNSIPVYYTWPNLLNHRTIRSLVPGRSSRRRAQHFVEGDAEKLTWDGWVTHVHPPKSALDDLRWDIFP